MVDSITRLPACKIEPSPETRAAVGLAASAAGFRPERLRRLTILAYATMVLLLAALIPRVAMAHEAWLLTPDHMAELNARPRPDLFTRVTPTNVAMVVAVILAVSGWILLAVAGGERRWPALLRRLRDHERHTARVLRTCLALTMIMAATGLHPRHGTALLEAATLCVPDLELRLLGPGWGWLAAVELALAAALLLGRQVRAAAVAVLCLTALGIWLFGTAMLAYAGAMAGAASYLILRGAGPSPGVGRASAGPGLQDAPGEHLACQRALFLVRALTGATFLYCGIEYKVLQPNLALAIIVEGHVPTLGLGAEAFVFGMALVEVSAGALMMAGLLIRPLALALFCAFVLLGAVLGESPLGHVLFYGNLFALVTGGAGSWRPASLRHAAPCPAPA
jgi:hypothetical protein